MTSINNNKKTILLPSEARYRTESLKLRNLFLKQSLHTVIEAEYGIPVCVFPAYFKSCTQISHLACPGLEVFLPNLGESKRAKWVRMFVS